MASRSRTDAPAGKSELLGDGDGDGDGIHWPLIDEDLSVAGLLAGRRLRSA